MAQLSVTPDYLEKLALQLDDAKSTASDAAGVTGGMQTAVWLTHGILSGWNNAAVSGTNNDARGGASKNIYLAVSDLAAKLRTAKQVYSGVDDDLASTIKTQMLTQD